MNPKTTVLSGPKLICQQPSILITKPEDKSNESQLSLIDDESSSLETRRSEWTEIVYPLESQPKSSPSVSSSRILSNRPSISASDLRQVELKPVSLSLSSTPSHSPSLSQCDKINKNSCSTESLPPPVSPLPLQPQLPPSPSFLSPPSMLSPPLLRQIESIQTDSTRLNQTIKCINQPTVKEEKSNVKYEIIYKDKPDNKSKIVNKNLNNNGLLMPTRNRIIRSNCDVNQNSNELNDIFQRIYKRHQLNSTINNSIERF
jgi:hypothetical protein